MKIIVKDIINKDKCLSLSDGKILYDVLEKQYCLLGEYEQLIIDFTDIKKITSTFINVSICRIFGLDEPKIILSKIYLYGLDIANFDKIWHHYENAIEFYKNKVN